MTCTTALTGLLLAGASMLAAAGPSVDMSGPLAADASVNIQNLDGRVEVRGWDKSTVHVGGTLGDKAQRVKLTGSGDALRIKVLYPEQQADSEGANLIIDLPRSASIVAATVSADVEVVGLSGAQQVRSVSGDVQLDGTASVIDAQSVSGDVSLEANDTLPKKALLSTTSGGLSLSGTPAANGVYALNAISGDSNISMPEDASVSYDLRTISGSIDNAFGPDAARSRSSASIALVFSHGEDGAQIVVRSVSGDISLADSGDD